MDDVREEIEELKHHIDMVSPMIERDYGAIDENTPFPIRFAATWSKWTLDHKKEELKELQDSLREHELEVHLTGTNIEKGTAPVEVVASFLSHTQKLTDALMQKLFGTHEKKDPALKNAAALQLTAFEPGSFIIRMKAPDADKGLFQDDDSGIWNDGRLDKTTAAMLDLMSAGTEEAAKRAAGLGPSVLKAYRDVVKTAAASGLNADYTFYKDKGAKARKISLTHKEFSAIASVLDDAKDVTSEESYDGRFVSLDAESKTFKFRITSGTTIKGKFGKSAEHDLKEYHVSPVTPETFHASLRHIETKDILQNTIKETWVLVSITPSSTR